MPQPDASLITTDIVVLSEHNVELHVLRLDKIHPVISGNKWFKLKYHLDHFKRNNYDSIVTFGGAWSNHIVATAAVCAMNGIQAIGIIRGEEPKELSPTLKASSEMGMKLHFITRNDYSKRNDEAYLKLLAETFPRAYFIAEGGAGPLGEAGVMEIAKELSLDRFRYVACAIGSGTMYHALKKALPDTRVLGFPAIKGYASGDRFIYTDYHFGGYAKHDASLIEFMNRFYSDHHIPTDIVYTSKMFYGLFDLIKKRTFDPGSIICCIHSGGLQGNLSLPKSTLMF